MSQPELFTIQFDETHHAGAIHIPAQTPPPQALAALDLPPYQAAILVHGGAANMEPDLIDAVRHFMITGLAPLAEKQRILIIDGGTQSGSARALGDARQTINGTFPLVGVVPFRYVLYPGGPPFNPERIPLNPAHTHFIFVDGEEFGAESGLMVGLLRATGKPGLALIVNGGDIVLNEVRAHAVMRNTLVVVNGSGRIADKLADPGTPERRTLPSHVRLHVADIQKPDEFAALITTLLNVEPPAPATGV